MIKVNLASPKNHAPRNSEALAGVFKIVVRSSVIAALSFVSAAYALTPEQATEELNKLNLEQVYATPLPELEDRYLDSVANSCVFEKNAFAESSNSKEITTAEACAIYIYTNLNFGINRQLWETDGSGRGLTGEDWAYVRVLDEALRKLPNEKPQTVYRGTRTDKPVLKNPGQILRFKSYTSTSTDLEVAKSFLSGESDRMMVINVISGKDLSRFTGLQEKEILIPRSSWLRFDRRKVEKVDVSVEGGETEVRRVEFIYLTEVPAQK